MLRGLLQSTNHLRQHAGGFLSPYPMQEAMTSPANGHVSALPCPGGEGPLYARQRWSLWRLLTGIFSRRTGQENGCRVASGHRDGAALQQPLSIAALSGDEGHLGPISRSSFLVDGPQEPLVSKAMGSKRKRR